MPGGSAPWRICSSCCARRHLLREQRGLDAVEQALQPADQLRLRDAQFGVGRDAVLGERQREPIELLAQLRRQPVLEFADAGARGSRAAGCGWRRRGEPRAPPRAVA